MTVGILLVTHNGIGEQLNATVTSILKHDENSIKLVSIPSELKPNALGLYADRVRDTMASCEQGDGVLVLTDIHGATPNNLARHFAQDSNSCVISGINLPMLLRVLSHCNKSLTELCKIALDGGSCGIIQDKT